MRLLLAVKGVSYCFQLNLNANQQSFELSLVSCRVAACSLI